METVTLNRRATSDLILYWSEIVNCSSESTWVVLGKLVEKKNSREHAVIKLAIKAL